MAALEVIPGVSSDWNERILSIFRSFPEIETVMLFGSRAKGDYREGSDIDLAVSGRGLTPTLAARCQALLEEVAFPYSFDIVVDDEALYPPLKEHIARVGKRLKLNEIGRPG